MSDEARLDDEPAGSEPIHQLATFLEAPPAALRPRVRNSIQRRLLAGDLAELSLMQLVNVFMEFLRVTFGALNAPQQDGEVE